jgi:hypothetical protein
MRFLHYITDQEGNQIETLYASTSEKRFSLECTAKIKNAKYQVWDRETNEVITINLQKISSL